MLKLIFNLFLMGEYNRKIHQILHCFQNVTSQKTTQKLVKCEK